jgi:AI-2 transport protein TqsA
MTETRTRTLVVLLAILVVIAVGAALRATLFVTLPLAFAFFVTVLVWPLHAGLQRRLPARLWWVGIVVSMLVVLVTLAVFVGGSAMLVYRVARDHGPRYMEQWREQWRQLADWLREREVPVPAEDRAAELWMGIVDWLPSAALSFTGLATVLFLVVFFTLLMLVEAHHWLTKSRTALRPETAAAVIDAVAAITRQVRTFLLVQIAIAFITASITGLWLWVMGVPFVLLWTLLTLLLDFVPNIGPTVAGVLVTLVAIITLGWERSLVTALGILAIQQSLGSYVDPTLKGHRMDISPLVVLLSVVFWTWVWGPAGAVIAVPMTATLIIACAHVPALRPIALLLARTGDQRRIAEQTRGH